MPYPDREGDGQDRNRTEEELDAEALLIFNRIKRGESRLAVAVALRISQATLKRRLQRAILNPIGSLVLREIEYERLQDLSLIVTKALEAATAVNAQTPIQDLTRLIAEGRQLSLAKARLRGLTEGHAPDDESEQDFIPDALRSALDRAEQQVNEKIAGIRGERRGEAS